MLTAAEQDYIEAIYRLEQRAEGAPIRISDIAELLGTRLPTVSRTVQRLTRKGLLRHVQRKDVTLSKQGRRIAGEIYHRHEDLVRFFCEILGLRRSQAERDACQIEHGVSPATAQRLHEFLEYLDGLPRSHRRVVAEFTRKASSGIDQFKHLPESKTRGWRT
jgi:DtxR family Mn-dependent transcriptional regulator